MCGSVFCVVFYKGIHIKCRNITKGFVHSLNKTFRINYKFIVNYGGLFVLTTCQQLLGTLFDASIGFCTASEEQRNKLHIHTLIHVFSPD